jgi:hypothetical protein
VLYQLFAIETTITLYEESPMVFTPAPVYATLYPAPPRRELRVEYNEAGI